MCSDGATGMEGEVVQMQEIRHALRFTVALSRRSYVYPATHQAGSTTNVNAPPMA